MLLLLLLLVAVLLPLRAPAETQHGMDSGVRIPEDFVPPAAHSDSGHIAPILSARKAGWWSWSRSWIQVRLKSHRQACTNGLCAKAKDLLLQVNPVTDAAMAMRGSCLVLLLPHILLPGSLAQTGEGNGYERFIEQHYDYPKTCDTENQSYCDYMMRKRGMTGPRRCKHTNTFIHAEKCTIRAVCGSEGVRDKGNIYNSTATFSLTICRLKPEKSPGHCTYKETEKTSKIRVACNQEEEPVHFESIMQTGSVFLDKVQTQLGRATNGLPRPHKGSKQGAARKPQLGTES